MLYWLDVEAEFFRGIAMAPGGLLDDRYERGRLVKRCEEEDLQERALRPGLVVRLSARVGDDILHMRQDAPGTYGRLRSPAAWARSARSFSW